MNRYRPYGFHKENSVHKTEYTYITNKRTEEIRDVPKRTPAVLLIGKTGSGKSTLGNFLLGNLLNGEEVFETSDSQKSSTSVCQTEPLNIDGKVYKLVDTPGLLDTHKVTLSILHEIQRIIYECRDGIQAVIFVISATERFTAEQELVPTMVQEFLGKKSTAHIIIAFTKCNRKQTENGTLDFSMMQSFVDAIENRWVIVPNHENPSNTDTIQKQINNLKLMIANMESPYTIDHFKLARKAYSLLGIVTKGSGMSNQTREQEIKGLVLMKEANKGDAEAMAEIDKRLDALQKTESTYSTWSTESTRSTESTSGGCFTIDTTVITSNAKVIPLSQLEIGDRILCRGPGGKLEYSEVYLFIHYNAETLTEFRTIFFTKPNGTKGRVSLTPNHHIFVNGTIDFAGHVCPKSSKLLVLQDNSLVLASIDQIVTETKKGFVCVLTRSGTLIADEALCSCFCNILPSPTMQVLAQMAFAPLRLYTHFFRSSYRLPAVHPYAQMLVDIMLGFETISVTLMPPAKGKNAAFLTTVCFVTLMAIYLNMSVFTFVRL